MAQNTVTPQETAIRELCATIRSVIEAFGARTSSDYTAVQGISMHSLRSTLPHITIDEFLNKCETASTLTLPVALQDNDTSRINTEIQQLQQLFIPLQQVLSQPSTAFINSDPALVALLHQEAITIAVQNALKNIQTVRQVFTVHQRKGLMIPIGHKNYFIPFAVIGIAVACILFLSGSFALAASRIAPSKNHNVAIIATPTFPTNTVPASPTASSSGTATPGIQSTTTPGIQSTVTPVIQPTAVPIIQPTAVPIIQPTATHIPPSPVNAVLSSTSLTLCPSDDTTLRYLSGGTGSINWSAVSTNPSNIALRIGDTQLSNVVSGTLYQGQEVDITAQALNDGSYSGTFSITLSTGARFYVAYSTNCLSSGN